ncbi:MAG: hypothetical protein SGI71_04390 [Verrucomicrobiota bacterium]|nr:hypothetical protein [Verrucomicrobiota bacterium]
MKKISFHEALTTIICEDSRFDEEAYHFVREALNHTMKRLKKAQQTNQHVSGQELLEGIRDYALDQFGPMSKTVFECWGIRNCENFGEVVFNLVNKGVLGKTDNDKLDDFKNGFNFDDAFVKPFQPTKPYRESIATRHHDVAQGHN